jgi:hypothetical protein
MRSRGHLRSFSRTTASQGDTHAQHEESTAGLHPHRTDDRGGHHRHPGGHRACRRIRTTPSAAQVSEGLTLAASAKTAIAESFSNSGSAPYTRTEAGMTAAATDTSGKYVSQVDIVQGAIEVTYGNEANAGHPRSDSHPHALREWGSECRLALRQRGRTRWHSTPLEPRAVCRLPYICRRPLPRTSICRAPADRKPHSNSK